MEFSPEQAVAAAEAAGIDLKKELFTAGALAAGMTAELEHGAGSPDTDITCPPSWVSWWALPLGAPLGWPLN